MNKYSLLLLFLMAGFTGYSQVFLTVNVPSAGGLYGCMTSAERNTVTNLTISGYLDARDFVTLRDYMPVLSVLDISLASIVDYTGTAGTGGVALRTYPSGEIPYCAFWYNGGKTTLNQVMLPQTAHVVGMHAFQGCTGLIQANFPPSIDSIMYSAYHLCSGLIEINIPSTIQYIGLDAFARCGGNIIVSADNPNYAGLDGVLFSKTYTSLIQCTNSKSGYIIPLSVDNVCMDAFVGCTMLETLIIPFSVENIESGAFAGCTGLTELEFPNTVHLIPYGCCSGCTSLQSVIVPENIDTISDIAFSMCTSLTNINLPYSLNYIGVMTFWNCSALSSLNLPPQLSAIMPQAFRQCTSLESLVFPSSMSSLSAGILYHCSGLRKVVVPVTISSIQSAAFFGCSSLEEFHANNPVPVDLSAMINVFQGVPVSTCILYVPVGSKVLYETAPEWQEFENIVEDAFAGISQNDVKPVNVRHLGNCCVIQGVPSNTDMALYSLNGTLIFKTYAVREDLIISFPIPGYYILRIGKTTMKILL